MKQWQKIELVGAGFILASVFIEVFLLDLVRDANWRGHIFAIMENEIHLREMIYDLAMGGEDVASNVSSHRADFLLYSSVSKPWISAMKWVGYLVTIPFILGTGLLLAGKFMEFAATSDDMSGK